MFIVWVVSVYINFCVVFKFVICNFSYISLKLYVNINVYVYGNMNAISFSLHCSTFFVVVVVVL